MNNQFLKSFKPLTGMEEMNIFKKTRNNEVKPIEITEEQKEYIRKYLLKSECIQSTGRNTITVATNNSQYIIEFYDQFITLFEKINCNNMSKTQSNKRYIKYVS
jgi:hypothetical protein